MSFKRHSASPVGDGLAEKESPPLSINAAFYVPGTIKTGIVKFLVDTGAAMSVVHYDVVPDQYRSHIRTAASQVVGANGLSLDIMGTVSIPISLGTFTCKQNFIVATNLTIPRC